MPFFDAFRAVPGQGKLEIHLDYYGQPCIGFLQKKDAITVKAAVLARAEYITKRGKIEAPTIEQIKERLRTNREKNNAAQELKSKIRELLDNK